MNSYIMDQQKLRVYEQKWHVTCAV